MMRPIFLFLVTNILTFHISQAQHAVDLSYPEIDSLLDLYENNEEYDKGIRLVLEASQKSGKQDSLCGDYLEWAAYFYELKGDDAKVVDCYTKTLKIFSNTVGENSARYATTLNHFATFYKTMGNYKLALPLAIQSKNIREKVFGSESTDFATTLNNLSNLYQKMGHFDLALPLSIQAKNIYEKTLGKDNPDFAVVLLSLSNLYQYMGKYENALTLCLQAKNILAEKLGVEHPSFAAALNSTASLYATLGKYDKALPLYIQAKNIREKSVNKDSLGYATSLNNLASLYDNMGKFDVALSRYIQAKNIREKVLGKDKSEVADALNNIALSYANLGNNDLALPIYVQAKNIREKTLGKEHPYVANSLSSLASLYQDMGNNELALTYLSQAKDIYEKALGKEHPYYLNSLLSLASLHHKMGNNDLVLPLYIQAKNTQEKVFGKEHPSFATTLTYLATWYYDMQNYQMALPLYFQALNIREKALGTEHALFAASLHNLAALYKKTNNYDLAWKYLNQTIKVASGLDISWNISDAWFDSLNQNTYPSNAHLEIMIKSLDIAFSLFIMDGSIIDATPKKIIIADLAQVLLTKLRNQVSNEQDKLRILSQSNDWLQKSLAILNSTEQSQKAFLLADNNKSVLLVQSTKSDDAYHLGELPDSLIWQDKKLLQTQSQLQAQLLEKRSKEEKDSLRNDLIHVNENIQHFIQMIQQKHPKYHQLRYQQVHAKVENIQALLDEKTALIEYVIGDSLVHIFYIDKKQIQWSKFLISSNILNSNIESLHKALSDFKTIINNQALAYKDYTYHAHWFYQNLLEVVIKNKTHLNNLIIIADGKLGHLPFETFLVKQAPQELTSYQQLHYLVQDYTISYNYAASLWKENLESPAPKNNPNASVGRTGQIFGLAANYDLKTDSSLLDIRLPTDQLLRAKLSPLPAARKEVEMLKERYNGFFAFDALASEKTVKNKAADYAILHFATHGILNDKMPVLSSLAFSEDNDSIESNFWQAHEISKMQLNADLVVLSACETGYGKFEEGNGIASLARAFMYAGASSLIVSLWQVNDFATSEIMKNLYTNLEEGMKIDEALQQAKLQYISSAKDILAHPAFWSPFIQIGKTTPVKISPKGNNWIWGISFGIGVLGLGGLMMSGRKKGA